MIDARTYFVSYCSNSSNKKSKSIDEIIFKLKGCFERNKISFYLDNAHLKVNQFINEFIEKINICDNVIIFVNDDYFKSWWCMLECVKALNSEIKKENIFCIVTDNLTKKLRDPVEKKGLKIYYINYWNVKLEGMENKSGINFEDDEKTIKKIKEIIANIDPFINLIEGRHNYSCVDEFIENVNMITEMEKNISSAQMQNSKNIEKMETLTSGYFLQEAVQSLKKHR